MWLKSRFSSSNLNTKDRRRSGEGSPQDGVPADVALPGEAAEGLGQRLETVPLNYQDLELH